MQKDMTLVEDDDAPIVTDTNNGFLSELNFHIVDRMTSDLYRAFRTGIESGSSEEDMKKYISDNILHRQGAINRGGSLQMLQSQLLTQVASLLSLSDDNNITAEDFRGRWRQIYRMQTDITICSMRASQWIKKIVALHPKSKNLSLNNTINNGDKHD